MYNSGRNKVTYSAAFCTRISLPKNWICTKAARRLEIFSVYSFSSSVPSVILVVTMVGSFAPKRLFSRLYRFVRKKLELNSVPKSSRISRSALQAV